MAHNYEFRFEIKPGKFVYVQRVDAKKRARKSMARVKERYAPHRVFFHIGKRGGHVAALRFHQTSAFYSRFDLKNFFGHVTRGKLVRALKSVGFGDAQAFDIASDAVVVQDEAKIVPFGFCQSPLFATLALERSELGVALRKLDATPDLIVSVYMDDILISGADQSLVKAASYDLLRAAELAHFPLSTEKLAIAVEGVDIFNCRLDGSSICVLDERMERFAVDYRGTTSSGQLAIESYLGSLSASEVARLRTLVSAS